MSQLTLEELEGDERAQDTRRKDFENSPSRFSLRGWLGCRLSQKDVQKMFLVPSLDTDDSDSVR